MILRHYSFAGHVIKPYLRLMHIYNYFDSHKYILSLSKGQSMSLFISCILHISLNEKPLYKHPKHLFLNLMQV